MPLRNTSNVMTLHNANVFNSADEAGQSFDVSNYTEVVIYAKTTAKAGTTPGLTLDVEVSQDNSEWHKHTQLLVFANDAIPSGGLFHDAVQVSNIGKWLRVNNPAAPTGSATPTVTMTIKMIGKN